MCISQKFILQYVGTILKTNRKKKIYKTKRLELFLKERKRIKFRIFHDSILFDQENRKSDQIVRRTVFYLHFAW